jgi:DNA-binding Lrp family transcriptional regulator
MPRAKLDDVDRKMLAALQADGRMTNLALARLVGVSPPSCLRRMRALREAGYILAYHAELDPEALGFGVTAFAMVGLTSQAEANLVAFEKRAAAWPLVRECHMLAGEADFLLKIVAADWDAFQAFLTTELTAAPTVSSVKTMLAIRTSKREPGIPVPGDSPAPAKRRRAKA